MTVPMSESLPINCAARNATWVYARPVPPRFPGAPTITEITRSHLMPDSSALPEGADLAVELYGGAVLLRLDGLLRRIYTGRFEWVGFASEAEARAAFVGLWRRIERLETPAEVSEAAAAWRDESIRREG
jgi:hypothetical protein